MRKKIYEIIEVNDGSSRMSQIYDKAMMISIIISIIPLMFRSNHILNTSIEYLIAILFTIDYILRWITADYRSNKKGAYPFLLYPFTLIAIIDLLSILPSITYFNGSLRVFKAWRLLRILRVAKMIKYYEPLRIIVQVFKNKASILLTVVGFALFYIYVTALFMFNVEDSINPHTGQVFFGDFLDALYWATCTLTTVGYGDIYPVSDIGRIVSMISSLVGIAIIALPSSIITAGYMEEFKERRKKKLIEHTKESTPNNIKP